MGGFLCDNQGISVHQWKWDDMKPNDVERTRSELKIQVNVNSTNVGLKIGNVNNCSFCSSMKPLA
jgi:hypothetical protein